MNGMTYQLNPLIEARKSFDVMESRLFYLGLQDINPHLTERDVYFDEDFHDTIITPAKLMEIFGHGKYLSGQYLEEIKKTAERLIGRYIKIEYEDGWDAYAIFQHIKYKENVGLMIHFNNDMKPFLLDIYQSYHKYGFTKIEMNQIFILGSTYAMRLLELFLQYRSCAKNGIIKKEVSVHELRERLNVPDNAYIGRMDNFRRKVLDSPINDINEHTFYRVSYSTIKKGRTIAAFYFECDCSKVPKDKEYKETIEADISTNKNEKTDKNIEQDDDLTKRLKKYGFSKKTVKCMLEKCGSKEELERRVSYAERRITQQKKNPDNISGFLRVAILENWAGQEASLEEARAKEVRANVEKAEWDAKAKELFSNEKKPKNKEKPFVIQTPLDKAIIKMILGDIKKGALSYTSKSRLDDHGMTVARFVELYKDVK